MEIIIPFVPQVNAGGVVSLAGAIPGQAIYWELVGLEPLTQEEIAPYGSLKYDHTIADAAGNSANVYMAPVSDVYAGLTDRVKATVSGGPS